MAQYRYDFSCACVFCREPMLAGPSSVKLSGEILRSLMTVSLYPHTRDAQMDTPAYLNDDDSHGA
jgi:hypothetical protein